jgi:phospholipid/cholesterol/gamma-HCH transport system ATP-binding protein
MSGDCVIDMQHIWTQLDGQLIHRDIDLCVRRGEILGLVGASGSGKTVLLREMIGLQQPTQGSVSVFGQQLDRLDAAAAQSLRNRIGVMFQGGALFSTLNVFDNIALPLRESQLVDESLIRQLVCMKLGMVGLPADAAGKPPSELSGGMVKRAALARALALEPELLFLDEPTSGLDPISSQIFVELVRSLHQELRFTMVMVTHDLETLRDLCHRVAVLADQRLIAVAPLDEVMQVDNPFITAFFHGHRGSRVLNTAEDRPHG